MTTTTIAEPLVQRLARVLWDDDQERWRLEDLAQYGKTDGCVPWANADQYERAEYQDKARRVLDRLLP